MAGPKEAEIRADTIDIMIPLSSFIQITGSMQYNIRLVIKGICLDYMLHLVANRYGY